MNTPPPTAAAYLAALPTDPRVERKSMFGSPCAFVNRQMFFGTFEQTIVARVGPARASALAGTDGIRAFSPMEGRTWSDYVQVDGDSAPELLSALAAEALKWTLTLPPKAKPPETQDAAAKKEAKKEARKEARKEAKRAAHLARQSAAPAAAEADPEAGWTDDD